jgi:hypothetical protein
MVAANSTKHQPDHRRRMAAFHAANGTGLDRRALETLVNDRFRGLQGRLWTHGGMGALEFCTYTFDLTHNVMHK